MPFEEFLRSFKIVNNHIMRTRKLTHENIKFRKFVEECGLDANDVISDKTHANSFFKLGDTENETRENIILQKVENALKVEQRQRKLIEAELYVLRQDYHKVLSTISSLREKKKTSEL